MERQHIESSGLSILVVEDEEAILRGICDVLAFQGHNPVGAERGDLGLEMALDESQSHRLVVLDVMLPGMNGFDVCEKIRIARPELPILMLTARGSEEDVLRGFRSGADDYVTKPFSVAELVARIEALLRRAGRIEVEPPDEPIAFRFGEWTIDPAERIASLDRRAGNAPSATTWGAAKSAESIELTPRDLELLLFFRQEVGRIVSRRQLLAEIWGYPDPDRVETRSVDMHIAKLRKKLGARAGALIETIRGEGYRFRG